MGRPTRRRIVYAARIGYAAEGLVYTVLGVLALLAAFGESGGRLTDARGVVDIIARQPFGALLVWVMAGGLACYALWNGVRAILDPERHGRDGPGVLKRAGYLVASLAHFAVASYAAQLAYDSAHSSSSTRTWIAKLLSYPFGPALVAIVGAIAIGFGVYQIAIAVEGRVGEEYASSRIPRRTRQLSRRVARVGVFARGLVFSVIGMSLILASWRHDPGHAHGFGEALAELARGPLGTGLLALVAAGLLAYGVHLFCVARYGRLPAPR